MSAETLGRRLQKARRYRQWSQSVLAQLTGISRGRLSHFENDRRQPTLDESERLHRCLALRSRPKAAPTLPFPGKSWRRCAPPVKFEKKRTIYTRLLAARKSFGQIVNDKLEIVHSRNDRRFSELFLKQARLDSGHELLFWVQLLAAGGKPCWLAPLRVGFRSCPVVHPDSKICIADVRHPCLELTGDRWSSLLFPQLTLDARRSYFRLDALACVRSGGRRRWINVEIDGEGHDPSYDEDRQRLLGLLTVRLNRVEITYPSMLALLQAKLLSVFPPPRST